MQIISYKDILQEAMKQEYFSVILPGSIISDAIYLDPLDSDRWYEIYDEYIPASSDLSLLLQNSSSRELNAVKDRKMCYASIISKFSQ